MKRSPEIDMRQAVENFLSMRMTRRRMGEFTGGLVASAVLGACRTENNPFRMEKIDPREGPLTGEHERVVKEMVEEFIRPDFVQKYGGYTVGSEIFYVNVSQGDKLPLSLLESTARIGNLRFTVRSTFHRDSRSLALADMQTDLMTPSLTISELRAPVDEFIKGPLTAVARNERLTPKDMESSLRKILTVVIAAPSDTVWTNRIDKIEGRENFVVRGDGISQNKRRVIITINQRGETHVIIGPKIE